MNQLDLAAATDYTNYLRALAHFWNFQIFSIDSEPMTVGKVVSGIVLLILSYFAARRATQAVDQKFLGQLDIEASLRYTLRRAIFYFFLIVGTLFTLRILNVPITIFTVLGGALAIGVGFGSQNIVNNFISGLILMVERPVRVGDFIEMEGIKGTVEMIGTRSTVMRSPDNKHLIVPNSFFLEKAVLNWTLENDVIRSKVIIGVAYGSPVRRVHDLLLAAAQSVPDIAKDPLPRVVFADFGDSALIFHLLYWCSMNGARVPSDIESDLRFKIDELFRDAKISMPFPQREVHLELARPVAVQITANDQGLNSFKPQS